MSSLSRLLSTKPSSPVTFASGTGTGTGTAALLKAPGVSAAVASSPLKKEGSKRHRSHALQLGGPALPPAIRNLVADQHADDRRMPEDQLKSLLSKTFAEPHLNENECAELIATAIEVKADPALIAEMRRLNGTPAGARERMGESLKNLFGSKVG